MRDVHKCRPSLLTIVGACLLANIVVTNALASPEQEYFQVPPWQDAVAKGSATNPIRIGCIFVRFPNTDALYWNYPVNADQLLVQLEQSIQYQSNNAYYLDYSMLRDPLNPNALWVADHNSGLYQVGNPESPPADFPDCVMYDTWMTVSNVLPLEILSKIQAAFPDQQPLASYDAIAFVYRPSGIDYINNPLYPGYGGISATLVPASCPQLAAVFAGAPVSTTDNQLFGYTSVWWTQHGANYPRFNMAHEWGHKMGLDHAPGSGVIDSEMLYPEAVCNFGAYSVMRASHEGTIAYGMYDHWERGKLGWCRPDTITASRRTATLEDFGTSAQIIRIPIREEHGEKVVLPPGYQEYNYILYVQEYFLLAYEGGRDTYYDPLDTGLYVWHIIDTSVFRPDASPPYWVQDGIRYMDLEVASGLDSQPSLVALPWSHPDPVGGLDMLDCWRDAATGMVRPGYNWYNGSTNDLYNLGSGEKQECSFRAISNPNSNGIDWGYNTALTLDVQRPAAQNRQNAIMITILGQSPSAVELSILLAPYQNVSYPNGGEVIPAGQPVTITWNVDASLDINAVDILFSDNGGADYETIVEGEANDGGYVWSPTDDQVSSAGKIKVVCHNTHSALTGDDESDATFTITWPITFENQSDATGLDYMGTPYSSVVLDYDNDGKKDLFISIRDYSGSLQRQYGMSETDIPQFQDKTDYAFAAGSEPQYGLRGVAAADYDNDGAMDFFAAAESGARLYHNNGGSFADSAAAVGLSTYATYSWGGAWGDYDRDGQLDLYICRAEGTTQDPTPENVSAVSGVLMHNNMRRYGNFVGVYISGTSTNASIAAAWADVDGDSDLDLFVGDLRSYASTPICRLYINEGDGMFTEDFSNRFSVTDLDGISSVAWADMDNNGSLDLVLGGQLQPPMVFFNDGAGAFDGGAPLAADLSAAVNGVRPLDHDLDGRTDLVVLPRETSDHPWLFANRVPSSSIELVDESSQVGLGASVGRVDGIVAADFNGDGDEDLYLGRLKTSGEYFYRATTSSGDAPTANWVGVRLDPNSGANNNDGIGATVTVTVGDPLAPIFKQAQVVDGGSGRGGQADAPLIFGLGELVGTVQAKVRWPGGYVQIQQLVVGTVNVVNDLTVPTMVILKNQSPVFTYEVIPGTALVDWIFAWQTEFSCDPALDQVRVSCRPNQPSTCLCEGRTLHAGDPNVQASVYAKANGRYGHSLRWRGVPCAASCSYNFTMGSATQRAGSLSETSMVGTISFCPTDYDPEQE